MDERVCGSARGCIAKHGSRGTGEAEGGVLEGGAGVLEGVVFFPTLSRGSVLSASRAETDRLSRLV